MMKRFVQLIAIAVVFSVASVRIDAQQTGGLPALEQRVRALEAQVAGALTQIRTSSHDVATLQASLDALAARVAAIEAALSSDTPPPPPPPPPPPTVEADLSCVGRPGPTTAPAVIAIGGTVTEQSLSGTAQLSGVSLSLYRLGDTVAVGQAMSGANGDFLLAPVATGGQPFAPELVASKSGYVTTRHYWQRPLSDDATLVPMPMFSPATFSFIRTLYSAPQAPSNGTLLLVVADCASRPLKGATISATTNNVATGTVVDASATQPGLTWVFDVPTGTVTVGGSYQGIGLTPMQMRVLAGQISIGVLTP
jgi:hypothetical protein